MNYDLNWNLHWSSVVSLDLFSFLSIPVSNNYNTFSILQGDPAKTADAVLKFQLLTKTH